MPDRSDKAHHEMEKDIETFNRIFDNTSTLSFTQKMKLLAEVVKDGPVSYNGAWFSKKGEKYFFSADKIAWSELTPDTLSSVSNVLKQMK